MFSILPQEQPPLYCSVEFWKRKDVWVPDQEPPHSHEEEVKAGRAESLLCHGRNAGNLCKHSTTVPATPDSPAATDSLHFEEVREISL